MGFLAEDLPGKRLEIRREIVPQHTCIAVLSEPTVPTHSARLHILTEAARGLGLPLHVVEVCRMDESGPAFAAVTAAGAAAVIVLEDAVLLDSQRGHLEGEPSLSPLLSAGEQTPCGMIEQNHG